MLPIGGVASERDCTCSLRSRLVFSFFSEDFFSFFDIRRRTEVGRSISLKYKVIITSALEKSSQNVDSVKTRGELGSSTLIQEFVGRAHLTPLEKN